MTQKNTPFGEGATNKKRLNTPILDEFQGIESIYEFESPQSKDRLKVICLILAVDQVAKNNNLSLKQQVEIYSPSHWNIDITDDALNEEFEAFKRCGSQGFISITESFDYDLAVKNWYSTHLALRNRQIIIDPDHIGFTSNQTIKKPFINPPIYIDKKLENKRIYNPRPLNRRQANGRR
tara:strand:+ start:117 stop:653 length:537 start_codon:yes stop_codon:yes gene_type:complete